MLQTLDDSNTPDPPMLDDDYDEWLDRMVEDCYTVEDGEDFFNIQQETKPCH